MDQITTTLPGWQEMWGRLITINVDIKHIRGIFSYLKSWANKTVSAEEIVRIVRVAIYKYERDNTLDSGLLDFAPQIIDALVKNSIVANKARSRL